MAKIVPPEQLDGEVLTASLERVASVVSRLAATQGVPLTAAATLRTLQRSGPCRLSELAVHEGITQPARRALVSRLERDGYVQRRGCADDARVVMVHLTPAGDALVHRRRDARARRLAELAGHLPADDRAAIAVALPALDRLIALHTDDRST